MPHVVVDQRCALREYLVASCAIWFAEQALEELLLGLRRARGRFAVDLPIGVARYAFEACVVFSARDWELGYFCRFSSSLPASGALHCLIHSTD